MRARILEESLQIKLTNNLKDLMKQDLQDKMAGEDFRKFSNKILTKKSKDGARSFVLSDGKFGTYYIDDRYFFVCYSEKNKDNLKNRIWLSYWNGDSYFSDAKYGGYYCPMGNIDVNSPQTARNLVLKFSRNPQSVRSYVNSRYSKQVQ